MGTVLVSRRSTAIYTAYTAAVLFASHLATYFVPSIRDATLAAASWQERGTIRGVGLFVALDTATYSCLGLSFSWAFVVALPSLVLLPVWFALVGRRLGLSPTRGHRST